MADPKYKHVVPNVTRKISASQYNNLLDSIRNILNSMRMFGLTDSSGILLRQHPLLAQSVRLKIFEVQSAAIGDGVYNCYEQTLDATEWDDTVGDDKFDDKNIDSVEVLNLLENDTIGDYTPALGLYDRLQCWRWTDDEGNRRWVGIPIVNPV
ncbi:hypothetical protein LCGC14_2691790, partial [marine sediment metagenome]